MYNVHNTCNDRLSKLIMSTFHIFLFKKSFFCNCVSSYKVTMDLCIALQGRIDFCTFLKKTHDRYVIA